MPVATPEQIDRVLQSVEYPADRETILSQARRRRAGQAVRSTLERLPEQSYDSPANVRAQLERVEPALKSPRTTSRKRTATASQAGETNATQEPQLQLPEPIRQAAETVRVRGGRVIEQARSQIVDEADRRRTAAAASLASTASTMRQAGTQLEDQNEPPAARLVRFAADQLEAGASYLERADARQILSQAQGFARRQPWLVLGIGATVGFVASRILKSADLEQFTSQDGGGQSAEAIGSAAASDAIGLLETDHQVLRRLLRRGQSAAVERRKEILAELKRNLQSHERMEEEVFYPALKENPATKSLVMESYAEHKVVDEIMSEIEATDAADDQWPARFVAMKANLEHHAEEEETELFPVARKAFTRGELREMGSRMSEIKQLAMGSVQR